MERKNVVVTGANGLLGSHLLPLLIDTYDVWAISRNPPVGISDYSRVNWIKYDLAGELSFLKEMLPTKIDVIIHLAQSPFFRDFPEKAQHVFNVNVNTTMYLLDLASSSGCSHFVNASSGGVYAFSNEPLKEEGVELLSPGCGFYPVTKQCGELLVNAYAKQMNTLNLRFFFIYGRGQERSMLIPRLIDSVKEGKEISLQGTDGLHLNPVHASDAARAVQKCLDLEGSHTINVAGKDTVSLKQLGEMIGVGLGVKPKFHNDMNQKANNVVADVALMKQLLIEPEVDLVSGIEDLCRENLVS